MGLKRQTPTATDKTSPSTSLKLRVPDEARILIVSDDDSDAERLKTIFRQAGFNSERARSMTVASEWTKSGRFQVVVSTPLLSDGSWRRLTDVANHHNPDFVVILLARTFDLREWAEALKDGAFDVLDALHELPRAVEVAKRALWAAYLKGAGPDPEAASC